MNKRALIFGIGGMDGSYIAEVLINNGYEVYGTTRRSSVDNLCRVRHIKDKIKGMYRVDLTDALSVHKAVNSCRPCEIYNEADQDNVGWSHSIPGYSIDVTIKGSLNLFESVRLLDRDCKVFIPVSSTIYGDSPAPQDELSPINPLSPYAWAKASVYQLARYYRQIHGLWVSTGILYNHDSPRRGRGYLLQDIYRQLLAVSRDEQKHITLGNLNQSVDIGYAKEFAEGIYAILQAKVPMDIILSSGSGFKIADIVAHYIMSLKLEKKKIDIRLNEDIQDGPKDIELVGDIRKAQSLIGWKPKYNALNMIEILSLPMAEYELVK